MMAVIQFLAQLDYQTLVPQFGFGGVLIWVIVSWLKRIETGLDTLNHSVKGLTRSILLDLAERATPGSFIREEAKRMVAKDNAKDDARQ